jgi:hypothetical protein
VKSQHHGFIPDLDGKKSLEWGKKSLYGALSKPDKITCAKVRSNWEQVAMAQIKSGLSPD